ncbi:MAG: leucine-rich repeat domain-containing protein [Clostridiales bacterium]|nr:leucine-rich repeat domain-containing protein [Clostridiales bacterium]
MKKIISLLLSAAMLLPVTVGLDLTAFAATSGDYEYTVSNGTAEITGYTGLETELTIPSTIDGYTVTSIGEDAFYNCTGL